MPEYAMPSFEEVLFQAVVERFFQPEAARWEVQYQYVNGAQVMVPVAQYGESPVARVMSKLYRDHADDIAKRVFEKIDLVELADAIAERVIADLSANNRGNWSEVTKVRDMVNDRVAAELTRLALDKIRAEEAKP